MPETKINLETWINKINSSNNAQEIFKILEEFRIENSTNEEKAQISKVYINKLLKIENSESPK